MNRPSNLGKDRLFLSPFDQPKMSLFRARASKSLKGGIAGPSSLPSSSKSVATATRQATPPEHFVATPKSLLRQRAQQRIALVDSVRPWQPLNNSIPSTSTDPTIAPSIESEPTLLDSFGRDHTYLRISLTERCSFRCTYCMPAEGVPLTPSDRLMTAKDVKRLASTFVSMGVKKIRLTGGEPTLRSDLVDIVKHLDSLKPLGLESIGLTTNGLVLDRVLEPLVDAGLTHLNVSIDSLKPDKFARISRMTEKTLPRVLRGVDRALQIRSRQQRQRVTPLKVKLNVVVMKGMNEDEVVDFVDYTKNKDLDVRFIEYMPFNSNSWSTSLLVPASDLLTSIQRANAAGSIQRDVDERNDTTRHYSISGHQGRFGFISSMTDHFCGSCNRIRVLADGNLKVCLFGNREVSLREALRVEGGEQQLKTLISQALGRKHFKHAGMKDPKEIWLSAEGKHGSDGVGREMSRIGG